MFDLRNFASIHDFARAVADDWRWQASYDKRSGAVTLYHYDYGIEVRHDLSVVSRPFRTDSRARDVLFAMTGVRVDLVQRADCDHLALASDLDPAYARAHAAARAAGVETLAFACRLTREDITLDRPLLLDT